jgi:hypothetical protein
MPMGRLIGYAVYLLGWAIRTLDTSPSLRFFHAAAIYKHELRTTVLAPNRQLGRRMVS